MANISKALVVISFLLILVAVVLRLMFFPINRPVNLISLLILANTSLLLSILLKK